MPEPACRKVAHRWDLHTEKSILRGLPDLKYRCSQNLLWSDTELSHPSARKRAQAGAGCSIDDRLVIDAVGAIEIGDVARLAETVDTQRHDDVAGDGAEPRQCRRMEVADRNERGARAQPSQ